MAIDTSTSPYFDDYDANKNYTKILFKPGLAVQARELNQTQSILQNQIKTLADTLFADGDSVSGLESSKATTNRNYRAVKLKSSFNNVSINVNDYLGKFVTCTTAVDQYQSYEDFLTYVTNQGYDITLSEITLIADYFSGQELLYTIDSINYYKLYRKPRFNELLYWVNRYMFGYNKVIGAAFKQEFILKITADDFQADATRITDDSKTFLSGASDNSVFYLDTFVPYRLIGEVVQVFDANDPIPGDPPTIIIKCITAFGNRSFPSGDTLLFYNTQDNAINKINTNLKATTEDDIVFTLTGSLLASETEFTSESPNFDIKVGDYITHPSINENLYITKVNSSISFSISALPKIDITADRFTVVRKNTVPTLRVTIGSGVYYKSGYMIRCEEQSIVPEKYNAWPFKSVGLDLVEEIVTSNDDSSLLDPALEASNYLAVGADRLKLSLILNSYDLIDNKPDVTINYKELKRFFNGVEDPFETKNETTLIRKELAERTYDESGNYTIGKVSFTSQPSSPFSRYFDVKLSPLNAYIGGFNVKTNSPLNIPIEKETSTELLQNHNIKTNTGNYVIIEAPSKGFIDTNQLLQSNIFVEMHSSVNVSSSTKLGDAAVKSIEYLSGLGANTLFKLNTFVTNAIEGKNLADTRHIIATKNYLTATAITTWSQWTATYGYSETDGRAVASALYQSSSLLGTYNSKTFYGLFRDPDAEGLSYWVGRYINTYNRIITTALKNEFISGIDSVPSSFDYTRSLQASKSYYYAPTGSVFLAGVISTDYTSANIYFRANIASSGISNSNVVVFDPNPFDTYIFNTGQTNTKTTSNINYEGIRVVKGATFSNGVYNKTFGGASPETFPFGDGNIPRTAAAAKVQILVVSGNTANTSLGIFDFTNKGTVIVSSSSKSMSIDLNDASFNGKADIMYTVDVENITKRTKTRVNNATSILTLSDVDVPVSLLKSDIASFKGIYKIGSNTWTGTYSVGATYYTGNVVINENRIYVANTNSVGKSIYDERYWNKIQAENSLLYLFDDGQRDTYYDHGSVTFIGDANKTPGRCLVLYDYYTHSGEGPLTADSYPSIFNIPSYKSTVTSRIYNLRNSLDFRPRRNDDTVRHNYDSYVKPTMSALTECDISYYLNRIDKIYITNRTQNIDGTNIKLKREKGIPSKNPLAPSRVPNPLVEMLIGTVFVPAYSGELSSVIVIPENITRKTMRDINILSQRLDTVEKRIKIHSLEIAALKSKVIDNNGDELLKTGIYVDDFSTTSKLDSGRSTIGIVIDTTNKICMPAISVFNFRLTAENTQNISIIDNLAQMKYTEEEFCSQQSVTITTTIQPGGQVNVNPGGSSSPGRAVLNPPGSMSIKIDAISSVKTVVEQTVSDDTVIIGIVDTTKQVTSTDITETVTDGTTVLSVKPIVPAVDPTVPLVTQTDVSGPAGPVVVGPGATDLNNAATVVGTDVVKVVVTDNKDRNVVDVAPVIVAVINSVDVKVENNSSGTEKPTSVVDTSSNLSAVTTNNGEVDVGSSVGGEYTVGSAGNSDLGSNADSIQPEVDNGPTLNAGSTLDSANQSLLDQLGNAAGADLSKYANGDHNSYGDKLIDDVAAKIGDLDGIQTVEHSGARAIATFTAENEAGSVSETFVFYFDSATETETTGPVYNVTTDGQQSSSGTGEIGSGSGAIPVNGNNVNEVTSSTNTSQEIVEAAQDGITDSNASAASVAMGGTVADSDPFNQSGTDPFARATWETGGSSAMADSSGWGGIGGGGGGLGDTIFSQVSSA